MSALAKPAVKTCTRYFSNYSINHEGQPIKKIGTEFFPEGEEQKEVLKRMVDSSNGLVWAVETEVK